jgi:von Willebrand factor type A domain-containing protein
MNKNLTKTSADKLNERPAAARPLTIHSTEIGFVLDASQSMAPVAEQAIKGFNQLVGEQQKIAGAAHFSLTCFNNRLTPVYDGVPLADIDRLTAKDYQPNGGTALNDAIGTMIDTVAARTNQSSRVLIAILTDGEENSSSEYSLDDVASRIWERRFTYGWQFLFLSASPDALKCGQAFRIPKQNIVDFSASPQGLASIMQKLAAGLSAYRLGDKRFALKLRND